MEEAFVRLLLHRLLVLLELQIALRTDEGEFILIQLHVLPKNEVDSEQVLSLLPNA